MRVLIKGMTDLTFQIKERILSRGQIDVLAFTDNNPNKWDDRECFSPFKALELYKEHIVEKILINTVWDVRMYVDIYKELIELGISEEDILFIPIEFCLGQTDNLSLKHFKEINYLPYIEFHLTNRCNLGCSGCAHFIPLIPDTDEVEFSELAKDLAQLKTKVEHVSMLRIMGGEPLLSSYLAECCCLARKLYPYSRISVATNGVLLGKISDVLKHVVRENKIIFDITCYPPFYPKYEEIMKKLKNEGIEYHMGSIRWGMRQTLHRDTNHKFPLENVFDVCKCVNLYAGKLWTCPPQAFISYFNNYFGEHFPEAKGIDIYSDIGFSQLWDELYVANTLCDFCNKYSFNSHLFKSFRTFTEDSSIDNWCIDSL